MNKKIEGILNKHNHTSSKDWAGNNISSAWMYLQALVEELQALLQESNKEADKGLDLKTLEWVLRNIHKLPPLGSLHIGDLSDGYHTFNELYEFRKLYNAGLFNEWAKQDLFSVHKSKKHSDGEGCFGGGWFIVTATLPTGQISNHYELKDWDLFQCEERKLADVWDGHTSQDVAKRLQTYLQQEERK